MDLVEGMGGPPPRADRFTAPPPARLIVVDARDDAGRLGAYGRLRHREFVATQRLFSGHDIDDWDRHPETIVLTALSADGTVLGGVRLHPEDGQIGWWRGSRLVTAGGGGWARRAVGEALVRAACARALEAGALRFDAYVQSGHQAFFARLGWSSVRRTALAGRDHLLMRWPVERLAEHAHATKSPLGDLVGAMLPGDRWRGDDGVPLAGTEIVTCVDAITPSMVDRDPEWAGWCGMLVTAGDLAAMGATPIGVLDAVGGRDSGHVSAVLRGLRAGAEAFSLPVLGGHTQIGVPGALSVSGFGRTADPVPGGGGRAGDALWLCADTRGQWRRGYRGQQWDSTSDRSSAELRSMLDVIGRSRPHAAKDASMAGIVGTLAMLTEASGCGAELEVARIPRPNGARMADWLTCFPGFAMLLAQPVGASAPKAAPAVSRRCGSLSSQRGVRLRWPDGELTTAIGSAGITGLGVAA